MIVLLNFPQICRAGPVCKTYYSLFKGMNAEYHRQHLLYRRKTVPGMPFIVHYKAQSKAFVERFNGIQWQKKLHQGESL